MWLKQKNIMQDSTLIHRKLEVRGKSIQLFIENTVQHSQVVMEVKTMKLDFEREMNWFLP